jgi:deoxyuridine 5'-triphosphate nucleotidohydrolase
MSLNITLGSGSICPTRAYKDDAGYDLYAAEEVILYPHYYYMTEDDKNKVEESKDYVLIEGKKLPKRSVIVPTNIQIALDHDSPFYAKILDRSSMAVKNIRVSAGVIDAGYRGNIGVVMSNDGYESYVVKKGEKIAQLIFHEILTPSIKVQDKLDETQRGDNGYGSSDF